MGHAHGLFIPEKEYLVDLRGLIVYLSDKVSVGHVCIYCNKQFNSSEGARAHMIDKGHCKIPYTSSTEIMEYSDYYDFSASYPTDEKDAVEEDNDSEWSDDPDDDASSVASEDLRPVQVSHDILELRLPHVGKRLGHRSLARYYRQNLRPEKPISSGENTHRLMIEASGLTSTGRSAIGVRRFGERSMMVEMSKRRHAEREARRFRDQREREQFRTAVAFRKTGEFKKFFRGIMHMDVTNFRSLVAVVGMVFWSGIAATAWLAF
jgi:pre-60S factor REI1